MNVGFINSQAGYSLSYFNKKKKKKKHVFFTISRQMRNFREKNDLKMRFFQLFLSFKNFVLTTNRMHLGSAINHQRNVFLKEAAAKNSVENF